MLFDLRGRGRRRTVRTIYLSLAVLMGGGLVLFGIGGATSGGLFDALGLTGGGTTGGGDVIAKRADQLQERVERHPRDAAAWGELARVRFQQAGQDGFDANSQRYTEDGIEELRKADAAWRRYLKLDKTPDPRLAQVMVTVYGPTALNDPDRGVSAAEIVTEQRPSASAFYSLATFAYLANQTHRADLAAAEAVRRSPKSSRSAVRNQLKQVKKQVLAQQVRQQLSQSATSTTTQGAAGGASSSTAGASSTAGKGAGAGKGAKQQTGKSGAAK